MDPHKLRKRSRAANQKMRRHSQAPQIRKRRVGITVKLPHEQILDVSPAELTCRQADVMDHQQFWSAAIRPLIPVRRGKPMGPFHNPALGIYRE